MADESTTHALYLSAERQAEEYRQQVLRLEKELEDMRTERDRWKVSQAMTYDDLVKAETKLAVQRAQIQKAIEMLWEAK